MSDRARTDITATVPLYGRLLGSSWSQIAEPLRSMHAPGSVVRAHGRLRVACGAHPVARILAWVLRLPEPNRAADTRLIVTARAGEECWDRTFGGRRIETLQYVSQDDLVERFGVLEFRFRLQASGGSLLYVQREAAVLCWPVRLRIPAALAPRVEAREDPAGSKQIAVDVRVVLPGVGKLISYAGIVEIEDTRP
jgi:Domain of unknown function (DUF4166)